MKTFLYLGGPETPGRIYYFCCVTAQKSAVSNSYVADVYYLGPVSYSLNATVIYSYSYKLILNKS